MNRFLIRVVPVLGLAGAVAFASSSGIERSNGRGFYVCAPEVVESNLKAAENVLTRMAKLPEFSEAQVFQTKVAEIQKLDSGQKKFEVFMGLVDVNPDKVDDVANFIGARDLNQYAAVVEKKLSLNKIESQRLVEELTMALRGSNSTSK
jgi:hypothetical protein